MTSEPDDGTTDDGRVPIELVSITTEISETGVREVSRETLAVAWISHAQLDAADFEDESE
jgi:hypothetical protein